MAATRTPAVSEIWDWLRNVPDPEIPVLSIVDLGIVRDVQRSSAENAVIVTVTPTYSGCPAMSVIHDEIFAALTSHGIERVQLETRLSPAWTTDWMTEDAKERLRAYGIAPPPAPLVTISYPDGKERGEDGAPMPNISGRIEISAVPCPRCGSDNTDLVSRYGSTACKALYKCRTCLEPFDAFKRH